MKSTLLALTLLVTPAFCAPQNAPKPLSPSEQCILAAKHHLDEAAAADKEIALLYNKLQVATDSEKALAIIAEMTELLMFANARRQECIEYLVAAIHKAANPNKV